jgi:YjbE family integral membrane protein
MAPFTPDWWSALASIVLIDIVLAGDNALVIGMAARNVPADRRRRVILWGTAGAIGVRVALTGVVVWLLKIPGFLLVGGLALLWIGWKLTREDGGDGHNVGAAASVRAAVQTIIVADAVMGVDNVIAIGGAAHGNFALVLIGIAISIPIVVWGSALVVRLIERYPAILWAGAGVLGWTAAKMIAGEPLLAPYFAAMPALRTVLYVLAVGGLVLIPLWRSLTPSQRAHGAVLAFVVAWVTLFGWIEDRMDARFDLFEEWHWDNELVDLVRWVGWIPLAIALGRRLARGSRAPSAPPSRTP